MALVSALPVTSYAQVSATSVTLDVPPAGVVGEPVQITCVASDPAGISRMTLRAVDAAQVSTVLGVGFGVDTLTVTWVPAKDGPYMLRCRANGQSTANAEENVAREILVAKATSATPPPTGPVEPPPPGVVLPPEIGAAIFQDDLPAQLRAPRRVAATPDGDVFVADADQRLHRLTRRGEYMAAALDGVVSLAAGRDVVWVGTADGAVVALHPRTGRVLRRVELGFAGGPVGLAFDDSRQMLWVALYSGALQMRTADGELIRHITGTPGGTLVRATDVTVAGGLVWLALDRNRPTGVLHAFSADSGDYVKSVSGPAAGEFRVVGAVASAWNRLYVADTFQSNVRVIDGDTGATLEVLGSRGEAEGQLLQPTGAAVLPNGDLLVANMGGGRLDRFGNGAPLPDCVGDADCDYLPDDWELAHGMDPRDPRNALVDTDGDGLNDVEEYFAGANPNVGDTDGDGYGDAAEVATGFNPADPDDHRPLVTVDVPSLVDPGVVEMIAAVKDRGLGACNVSWSQTAGPLVALEANGASRSFIARGGVYRFEVLATCGGVASRPAVIDVTIRNLAPLPNATRPLALYPYGRARLSAQFASDVNGDAFSFWWDQVLGPPIIGAKPGASLVIAQVGVPGLYAFRVGVTDQTGREGAQEVPVLVVDSGVAPTAVVPAALVARVGESAVVDASGSYRSAAATFVWEQTGGTPVALDGAAEALTFVPAEPGRYAFNVSVVDGALRSPAAQAEVFVAPAGGELPVARVSAPEVAAVGVPAVLDGSASSGSGGALKYRWRQVSGPAAGLTQSDKATAKVVPFDPGSIELELVIEEDVAVGVPARVRVEARSAGLPIPVAVATGPGTAVVGSLVTLSGDASVGASAWNWTQVAGPWVPISGGPSATFTPATPGTYGFELEVDGGGVLSAPARVDVVVIPNGTEN